MTTTVDLDSDLIKDELSKLQGLPTSVSSWLVEPCIDSTDSEAIWVWAYLTDKNIFEEKNIRGSDEEKELKQNYLRQLRSMIIRKIQEIYSGVNVYIHFRSADEVI